MRTLLTVVVVAASVSLLAQGQTSPQTPTPTFRAGVDVITLDVAAVDASGRPVLDLRAPDFVVRIDGQPRRIVSVEPVRFDAEAARRQLAVEPFESFFTTNQSAPSSRLIVLAVDQLNIQPGNVRPLLQSASRFLDTLSPLDRVAFFAYPEPGAVIDFTTDRARVRQAMDTIVGAASRYESKFNIGLFEAIQSMLKNDEVMQNKVIARECRRMQGQALDECTRQVMTEMALMVNRVREDRVRALGALERLLEGLSTINAPKALILMSEGLILGDNSDVDGIVRAASRAQASINVLLMDVPRGSDIARGPVMPPTMTEDRDLQVNGLRDLAAASRGTLFNVVGNGGSIFDRLASELSAYYLVGVEETASDRNDRVHRIDVEVRRQGITLRSRRAFVLAPSRASAPAQQLGDLLRAPFGVAELPLRATTFAVQDENSGRVRLLLAADVDQAGSAPGTYTVGWTLIDRSGRAVASAGETRRLTPSRSGGSAALDYRAEVLVDPGIYSLRMGAVDGTGRRGAIVREVNAWKMAGEEFAVADLVIGAPPRTGQVVLASVEPHLDEDIAAIVELYAADASAFTGTRVAFEVGDTADSSPLLTMPAEIVDGSGPLSRTAQAVMAVNTLPPGRYVMRARITRGGTAAGLLARPFVVETTTPRSDATATTAGRAAGTAANTTVSTAVSTVTGTVTNSTVTGTVAGTVAGPAASTATGTALLTTAATIPAFTPPSFDRASVLAPGLVAEFLGALDRRAPSLKAAVAEARAGRYSAASLEALSEGDQTAAAFLKGLDLYTGGQFEQAAIQLNVAAGPRREFFPAAFLLGAAFAALGRDRDAASTWQLALGDEARPPLAYVLFADARLRAQQPQSVVDVLQPIWQRTPDDDALARRLGWALVASGRHAEALPVLAGYLSRQPGDQEALLAAITAQYEAAGHTGTGLSPAERTRLAAWAASYRGPQRALVDRYLAALR